MTEARDRHEAFMGLYIGAEPKIRAYARACGLGFAEVDDVAQELALVLWRKFDEYDPSRPFLPWALGVTHRLIQNVRKKKGRGEGLLGPATLELLADAAVAGEAVLTSRRAALEGCVRQLPESSRDLLRLRYAARVPLAELGRRLGKGLSAVNMILHRLRRALLECVERKALS